MELLLVIVITLIISAISIPVFVKSLEGNQLKTAAKNVGRMHRYARAMSVLRGTPEDQLERIRQQSAAFGAGALSRSADIVNAGLTEMTGATAPQTPCPNASPAASAGANNTIAIASITNCATRPDISRSRIKRQ